MEAAVAGVGHGAVRQQDLEEAAPVDRHVQRLLGGLQAAGVKIFWVPTTRTPVPSCRPEGSSLSWVDWPPGWRRIWYSRS